MLEYGEYKNLIDTLEQSNHDNTYQEVMSKESKTLDTINRAIKVYKDDEVKHTQFINKPISEIVFLFFNTWIEIITEITTKGQSLNNIFEILYTKDRLVYIGITLIIASIIFYYVEIASS